MRPNSVFALIALLAAAAFPAFAESFHIAPHLQNITPDAATLIWETTEPTQGVVEYGLEGKYDAQAKENQREKIHRVRLTGLQAATTYSYRVRAGNEEAACTFKTAPTGRGPVTFIVIGDTRRWENRWEETHMAEHTLQWNPDFYIIMGDLVVNGHKYELWPEHFKRFADLNRKYMMVTSRGNHEGSMLADKENDWFAKYHELPGDGEPYAAFNWGNTHFVLTSFESTATTAQWLDEHLPKVDRKYTVVAQHFPVYCSGYQGPTDSRKEMGENLKDVGQAFDKYHVTLDIAGHTHIYERQFRLTGGKRDDLHGTTYLVNGGDIGGNYPEWFTAVNDDRASQAKPTYTVVQCRDDAMEMHTFCWSPVENKIIEMDHLIIWSDEALPQGILQVLPSQSGDAVVEAIDRLGAMTYGPAAPALLNYLKGDDSKTREAAAKALREIASPAVAHDLVPYLTDGDLAVRREIARALEMMMPEPLASAVAKQAEDAKQDEQVRVKLVGALQLHGPAKTTLAVAQSVLKSSAAPAALRQRAAYALGRVATKKNVKELVKLVAEETDDYVLTRLAWTLNDLTGKSVNLSDKAPLRMSEPGKRGEFIKEWTGKAGNSAA